MTLVVGGAVLVEEVLIYSDFEPDQIQALGEPADLSGEVRLVLAQERESFFLVADSLSDEVGVSTERGQGHARGAEDDADGQPVHVILAVDATPTRSASHGLDEEAFVLIEAQRVNAQARAVGDLSDTQTRCDLSHAAQGNGWT